MSKSTRLQRINEAFAAAVKGDWAVWREDDNSNKFCMAEGISEDSADRIIAVMTEETHHQQYWKQRVNPER